MRESALQSKVIKYLQSEGAYVVKVVAASKDGVADLLVCYRGLFLALECKAPGKLNGVSPLQSYNINEVKKAGGISLAFDSLDTVKELICKLKQNPTK